MHARRPARSVPGFTLLELMIVIVIIGVLGAIVGLNFIGAADRAKRAATDAAMKNIQAGLKMYRAQYNIYPPGEIGLQGLVDLRIIEGFNDSWGRPMDYYSPTQTAAYELISYGEDGMYGTPDDIRKTPEIE